MKCIAFVALTCVAVPSAVFAQVIAVNRLTPFVCEDSRVVGVTPWPAHSSGSITVTFGVESKELKSADAASANASFEDDARTWSWTTQGKASTLVDLERNEPLARECHPYRPEIRMRRPTTPSRETSK